MTLLSWVKKLLIMRRRRRLRIHKSKRLLLHQTCSLSSSESLEISPVQEVILAADLQCAECQKRVAHVISQIDDLESVVVHVLEKKVTLARKSLNKGVWNERSRFTSLQ